MHGGRNKFLWAGLLLVLVVIAAGGWWLMTPRKPGPFGAISMSDSSLGYGTAWGYADAISAYKRSQDECNKTAPGADCTVRVSLRQSCGALAVSPSRSQSFVATDGDKVQAGAMALAQCDASGAGDCSLRENFCGNGS